jgi:flagellar protein FliL
MSATAEIDAGRSAPKRGRGLFAGLALMLALGGGGFYATWSGLVALPIGGHSPAHFDGPAVGFVPVGEIVVSLGPRARAAHLMFDAQLEVEPGAEEAVTALMPRVVDALNGYLRAVEERDLEEPSAMPRLRAQLLRRVQLVTGPGLVRDLLVTRFILK